MNIIMLEEHLAQAMIKLLEEGSNPAKEKE